MTSNRPYTQAEINAKKALEYSEFKNLNLVGVKDKVKEILDLIGRVEGIFSTYTKHDISHINRMLEMLDWLIPPDTKKVMTSVDWLLIVLAIYFHDLGMVVTTDEYINRMGNEEFRQFLKNINEDTDAKDYLARAEGMGEEEKNRFFYQEFVRENHASRIREWIIGQHSRHWNDKVRAITDEINSIMQNLPTRFRNDLALVCESHHKENLGDTSIYKITQRYGSQQDLVANIQYSAFLLRTADLIHVTKDRTPSVMFKVINFSDLKSVEEWDKQLGTFAVYMQTREFDPQDTSSHIIEVSADFTEERPFFALTEYISWADQQIKQTKQWCDSSKQMPDGKNFVFPWHTLKGDIRVEGNLPRQMRFELDRGRLLNLLVGHTIYNEATVAIRELLQNAIDAVRYQFYEETNSDDKNVGEPRLGKVIVRWDPNERELSVEDNGRGMDLDIIQNHLLRVGSSFYDTPQFQAGNKKFTAISKFGIGVLTCFMISDNVEIITCRGNQGRRIRMTSVQADYLLKDLPFGDAQLEGIEPHGTKVRLRLRPSVGISSNSVLEIVKHWIILPECEVVYIEKGKAEENIGFKHVSKALEFLYKKDISDSKQERDFETVTVYPNPNTNGKYELSFLTTEGYMPGQTIIERRREPSKSGFESSLVCIEGIRVDSHIPGFTDVLPALLSVRDNKKFRTTVSRASLEEDEEYWKVAIACAEAMTEFVKKQVENISSQEGHPLSQASSAGRWMFKTIRLMASRRINKNLLGLYKNVPLIVIEHPRENNKEVTQRELLTLSNVSNLKTFWTVDSRTVDYLGIITRDLGRELNVSDFIDNLQSDNNVSKSSPLIVDAPLFLQELKETHEIIEVSFSKKHQRTIIIWQKIDDYEGQSEKQVTNEAEDEILKKFQFYGLNTNEEEYWGYEGDYMKTSRGLLRNLVKPLPTAIIQGDIENIIGVQSRMGVVISSSSELGLTHVALNEALKKIDHHERDYHLVLFARVLLNMGCGQSDHRRPYSVPQRTPAILPTVWRDMVEEVNNILGRQGVKRSLSYDFDDLIGDKKSWFNVAKYWFDWNVE